MEIKITKKTFIGIGIVIALCISSFFTGRYCRIKRITEDIFNMLIEKYKNVNYVYQEYDYQKPIYISTKYGKMTDIWTRNSFSELICNSKVAFCSARGKDEEEGEKEYGRNLFYNRRNTSSSWIRIS